MFDIQIGILLTLLNIMHCVFSPILKILMNGLLMSLSSPPYGCISLLIAVPNDVSEMLSDPKEPGEASKKD